MKQIKTWMAEVLEIIKRAELGIGRYLERNWKNTDRGLYAITKLLICLVAGIAGAQLFPYPVPSFLAGAVLVLLLWYPIIVVAEWLIRQLLKFGIRNIICMMCMIGIFSEIAICGSGGYSELSGGIIGILYGITLIIFGRALWAFFHNKVHTPTVLISLCISGAVFAGSLVLLAGRGFEDSYIEAYLDQNLQVQQAGIVSGFDQQLESGAYTVETLEYSPVKDTQLQSDTVDLSFCVSDAKGLEGIRRKQFFGYDIKKAAIAGKVWYPKEADGCPVVFIVHGNHSIMTESYLGYEYMGEYLASYGYVVVSVDENVLNGLSHENDARAILLLENIKKLQQYNRQKDNPLYGKMDYGKIALAGHSRGGESIATACLFNQYDSYPENGMHKFDYHFNITSLIAIAPTVDQYMPADHEVELQDVNYLQLQGANDQDVSENMGNTQYSHVTFSGEGSYIKSALYIAGANHGQFNSLWGSFDLPQPVAALLNIKSFLTEKEQQDILKVYAKIFLDQTLENHNTYADLLTDYAKYSSYLPKTVYIQQYQKSDAAILCNYEEDSDLLTATDENVSLYAEHMRSWTEEMSRYSNVNREERENYVLHLSWQDTEDASYHLIFQEEADLTGKRIAFDICNMEEKLNVDMERDQTDMLLQIMDADGNTACLNTGDFVTIYPALPVRLGKIQYLTGENVYKHEYQTVSAGLDDFIPKGSGIDLTRIKKITIAFPNKTEGKVDIDNICLE